MSDASSPGSHRQTEHGGSFRSAPNDSTSQHQDLRGPGTPPLASEARPIFTPYGSRAFLAHAACRGPFLTPNSSLPAEAGDTPQHDKPPQYKDLPPEALTGRDAKPSPSIAVTASPPRLAAVASRSPDPSNTLPTLDILLQARLSDDNASVNDSPFGTLCHDALLSLLDHELTDESVHGGVPRFSPRPVPTALVSNCADAEVLLPWTLPAGCSVELGFGSPPGFLSGTVSSRSLAMSPPPLGLRTASSRALTSCSGAVVGEMLVPGPIMECAGGIGSIEPVLATARSSRAGLASRRSCSLTGFGARRQSSMTLMECLMASPSGVLYDPRVSSAEELREEPHTPAEQLGVLRQAPTSFLLLVLVQRLALLCMHFPWIEVRATVVQLAVLAWKVVSGVLWVLRRGALRVGWVGSSRPVSGADTSQSLAGVDSGTYGQARPLHRRPVSRLTSSASASVGGSAEVSTVGWSGS